MPDLNTTLHLDMYNRFKRRNSLASRVLRTLRGTLPSKEIYGLDWGDPEIVAPLKFIRDQFVLPYINRNHSAVEIGPGGVGGRGIYSSSETCMLWIITMNC